MIRQARPAWPILAVLITAALGAAACGSSSPAPSAGSSSSAPASSASPRGSGPVDVLYAGSLVNAMQNQIGPAFGSATGYTFQGYGAGSTAVANAIKGKVKVGDVFISAAADADTALEGTANGSWVSWYSTFGSSPLLIGYNPASTFATDLKTMPWYKVLTMSGIKIGRTDPVSDPKGKLTVKALTAAQTTYKLPGFAAAVEKNSTVFPEETLVGRLQSGQLDAGFFYSLESTPKNIPTVTLGSVKEAATFTVTVLNNAPHPAGAAAFIAYLLGPLGTATLSADGMALKTPAVTGDKSAVPASLASVVGG